MSQRVKALKWWDSMSFEDQFFKTIECNHLIIGDTTRNPDTLTGREIELIYNHFKDK